MLSAHYNLSIAASFHLKNLESDSLPLIGLAVQMRIRSLVEQMIQAKQHRTNTNHTRPPPMYKPRFENDLPAPMWDQVLYDDVEKVLSTIDRVEREEERQARKNRLARDRAEQEERERNEFLAQEDGGMKAGTSGTNGLRMDVDGSSADLNKFGGPTGAISMPGTPLSGASVDKKGIKEKKRKRETPAQTARNMSDDVRKKLSDQTATRAIGGKRHAWMIGGDGPTSNQKKVPSLQPLPSDLSINTSSLSAHPFPPQVLKEEDGTPASGVLNTSTPLSALARLTGVPRGHEASKSKMDDPANMFVTIRDALFVMEGERGKGAGIGSGTRPLVRAYLNRT